MRKFEVDELAEANERAENEMSWVSGLGENDEVKDECFDDKSEGKRSVEMLSLFIKENIYFALSWTLLSNK